MEHIKNQTFGAERALYGSHTLLLSDCAFDGPEDGESALKESSDIVAERCFCNLRYPFWHCTSIKIYDSTLTSLCRAALWYSSRIEISGTKLHGIKALRECNDVLMTGCDIVSPEFGWSVTGVRLESSTAEGEYFMLRSEGISLEDVRFKGKYSFQYIKNASFEGCVIDTKDAFWHAKDVTVSNCVIKGEYLAWYSENLTLENCVISGTQPFCYCKNLRLINCELREADLCFEKSEVEATITTPVVSIKNPYSGTISAPSVGELIFDDSEAMGKVIFTVSEKA